MLKVQKSKRSKNNIAGKWGVNPMQIVLIQLEDVTTAPSVKRDKIGVVIAQLQNVEAHQNKLPQNHNI